MKPCKVKIGVMFKEIPFFEVQIWAESKGVDNNIYECKSEYFIYVDKDGHKHKKYWDTKLTNKDVKDIKAIHKRNWENLLKKAEEGDEFCKWYVERLRR